MTSRDTPARVGVRDVARLAGVSTQTVSRVLNDVAGVREATRRRVLTAIQALDYRVNNAARALGTSTSRTLGVLASDPALHGPSAALVALEAAVRDAGMWMTTAYAHRDDRDSLARAAEHLVNQDVDGIILVGASAQAVSVMEEIRRHLPAQILFDGDSSFVQQEGSRLAVRHLIDLGHQSIGELRGPANWLASLCRTRGVDAALREAGGSIAGVWEGDWSAESGERTAESVAHAVYGPPFVTAIAVANDQMALGLMHGLRLHGIAVPDDVSVTGFDDHPDAAYYSPPLTSVRVDVWGEARRAVAALLGSEPASVAAAEVIPRTSTAPPR